MDGGSAITLASSYVCHRRHKGYDNSGACDIIEPEKLIEFLAIDQFLQTLCAVVWS